MKFRVERDVLAEAQPMAKNGYGQYLLRILKENVF